ncbi:MAG: hypothetical protein JST12_13920 [Armatimonadetes bacterium]|nr:hypothetical protein [Armatimonadota bacterium]
MGFLQKLLGEKAPDWAQPISMALYQEFQGQVHEYFAAHRIRVRFEWDQGGATDPATGYQYGFHNLIRFWREAPPKDRKAVLQGFLGNIFKQLQDLSKPIDEQLDQLMLRLYDREAMPNVGGMQCLSVGQNLVAALVINSDQSLKSVSKSLLEKASRPAQDYFDIAKENLWKQTSPMIERQNSPLGPSTLILAQFFGAAQIVLLDRYTEAGETYWVAAPNRDSLLLLKPTNPSRESLLSLLRMVTKMSQDSPGIYILPYVLEYKDGVFRDLCVKVRDSIEIA